MGQMGQMGQMPCYDIDLMMLLGLVINYQNKIIFS